MRIYSCYSKDTLPDDSPGMPPALNNSDTLDLIGISGTWSWKSFLPQSGQNEKPYAQIR